MCITLMLSVLLVLGASDGERRAGLRVYQGEPDSRGEFAFAVLLQDTEKPWKRFCSGSLIASNWVLTACHCLLDDPFVIKYGDFTVPANESKMYTNVIKSFVHPSCQIQSRMKFIGDKTVAIVRNDVGLVLIEKVPEKYAKLLALDYKTLTGLPAKYAGFGLVSEYPKKDSTSRQTMPIQVGEGIIARCQLNIVKYIFKSPIDIGPVVCLSPKCSNRWQGILGGDSGGPLVHDGRIVGVASALIPKTIHLFTPVSVFLEWIKHVMQSNG